MPPRIKKPTMAATRHRVNSGAAVARRREWVALRRVLQKTPRGEKAAIVEAFAQRHATSTRAIYRKMAALAGSVRTRKTRADAGLSKTPLAIIHRRIAFKAMARARKARRAICAQIDRAMHQAVQALVACDQPTCWTLGAELTQIIAEIEKSVRQLRAYERRCAAPIHTNVDAVSTQATGA